VRFPPGVHDEFVACHEVRRRAPSRNLAHARHASHYASASVRRALALHVLCRTPTRAAHAGSSAFDARRQGFPLRLRVLAPTVPNGTPGSLRRAAWRSAAVVRLEFTRAGVRVQVRTTVSTGGSSLIC
jgi:hypothetical protein